MDQYGYSKKRLNKTKLFVFVCIPLIIICAILVIIAQDDNKETVPAVSGAVQMADASTTNTNNVDNKNDTIYVQMPPKNDEQEEPAEEQNTGEQVEEKNAGQQVEDMPQQEAKTKVPVYDEEAKEKLSSIYSSNGEKRAFLTFDDGPSSTVTPKILDVLKENNIKATFFMLGSMVESNPEIAKRVYDEGHYVANHGYSHVYSSIYASPENVLAEYEQCNDAIKAAIGNDKYSSRLFRFPGGYAGGPYASIKKEAAQILADNGIGYVDWNCLTQDSAGSYTTSDLLKNLKETSWQKSSVVVLMHDTYGKETTYEMLQSAIDHLREQGFTFYSFYDIMGEQEV